MPAAVTSTKTPAECRSLLSKFKFMEVEIHEMKKYIQDLTDSVSDLTDSVSDLNKEVDTMAAWDPELTNKDGENFIVDEKGIYFDTYKLIILYIHI